MSYDGWHKLYEYSVYVENGVVVRAIDPSRWETAYPYHWSKKYRVWTNVSGECTLNTLYAGLKRGTYAIL